ncbi:MAG: Tol-Pal system beta propeller repeat protein TolB [Thiotrichales bacterium]|nr:Tol-Pal system beta propeller repeat protein TolB [Thiotrichales bacterium]
MKLYKKITLVLLFMICQPASYAVLDIQITEGMEEALPIAVVPFSWSQAARLPPLRPSEIIASDLRRSGRFNPMDFADLPQQPHNANEINFQDWRLLGMENIVIGNLYLTTTGDYEIEFRLFDVYRETQLAGYRLSSSEAQLRKNSHKISDIIYEKLTGVRGAFSTRIAYITVDKSAPDKTIHSLEIADADGFNPRVLLQSPEPLMSPSWSPDGKKLAYVSFEGRNSAIYIQEIQTGKRRKLQSSPGINSAPAWSPDGSRLALTLSKDGNPEIYILHIATGLLQRVTRHASIDTEPNWSSDGSRIIFTSDRSGGPQVYEVEVRGGTPQRLSFEGKYNARPRYSPDNKSIAMVHGVSGNYRIAVLERDSGFVNVLTDTNLDESPSFAPNGHMIIYATMGVRGTELAAVSADGRVHQRLALTKGEVREPAWGPFPEP